MATSSTVHMYDSGVILMMAIQDESGIVDLTSAQSLTLFFRKPDKTIISRPCQIVNATAGLARYVSANKDFDQSGRWDIQMVVKFGDSSIKHSNLGVLNVAENISSF